MDDDYDDELFDDEYDSDEEDSDDLSEDDFDDEDIDDYDDVDEDDPEERAARLRELELTGSLDGQQDGISSSWYTGYGMSVEDLDDLDAEEQAAYEAGYNDGYTAAGGWDNQS